jgi:hypothetical protein
LAQIYAGYLAYEVWSMEELVALLEAKQLRNAAKKGTLTMPQVPAYHWDRDKEKYHNNSKCGPGSEIPPAHRIPGLAVSAFVSTVTKLNAEGK